MFNIIGGIVLGIAGFIAGQDDDRSFLGDVIYLAIGGVVAASLTAIQFAIKHRDRA